MLKSKSSHESLNLAHESDLTATTPPLFEMSQKLFVFDEKVDLRIHKTFETFLLENIHLSYISCTLCGNPITCDHYMSCRLINLN